MTMESDGVIYIQSGPEIGVCSSKTFIGTITTLMVLAIRLAAVRQPASRPASSESSPGACTHGVPGPWTMLLKRSRVIHEIAF